MTCEGKTSDVEAFFASAPSLRDEDTIRQRVQVFIDEHRSRHNRLVCVTSGGTTVPLERRCVRFIDNFSSGNRGAASTEYFLKADYAVIFLYRGGTIQPFCRSVPDDALLTCLEPDDSHGIKVRAEFYSDVEHAIRGNHEGLMSHKLLKVPYTTLFEYLQILQIIATAAHSLQRLAMFYLAAAVSDFYVPWESMGEHKIQSAGGSLAMQLAGVPKMISVLREGWAPNAFCVSFKLETDQTILIQKANDALRKYRVHAVVANELNTRRKKVTIVTANGDTVIERTDQAPDVEMELVGFLCEKHAEFISNGQYT
ncbi:hypothetical protein KP509_07G079600 [Ceratopteris richardii]|uniref:DNA/pantothenate metabolism flavoprotein C-terminal domain-containing protein n=1 Tax=Ceratopteris richardii TaxID=49495 RepID=A0A8T2UG76_CERRI|nr:hypothetical protein KP509_07G079600 [Ceratopteris richardii]